MEGIYQSGASGCRAALAALFLVLSACSSGGDSKSSTSASSSSSGTPVPPEPQWQETGTLDNHLLFSTSSDDGDTQSLVSYDVDEQQHVVLVDDLVRGGKFANFAVSPDHKKIAYAADRLRDNKYEVFVTNADGSVHINLSSDVEYTNHGLYWPDGAVGEWSEDSTRLTFRHGQSTYVAEFTEDDVRARFLVSDAPEDYTSFATHDDSIAIYRLTTETGGETSYRLRAKWRGNLADEDFFTTEKELKSIGYSSDGQYFIFNTSPSTVNSTFYLYNLSRNMVSELPISYGGWAFSWRPESDSFAYLELNETDESSDLKLYDVSRGQAGTLLEGVRDFRSVYNYGWVEGGSKYAYQATQLTEKDDLIVVDPALGTGYGFSGPLNYTQVVEHFDVSDQGQVAIVLESEYISFSELLPRQVLISDTSASSVENLTDTLALENLGRSAYWLDETRLLVQFRDDEVGDSVYYLYDFTQGAGRAIYGDAEQTQGFSCFVVVNRGGKQCNTIFDKT